MTNSKTLVNSAVNANLPSAIIDVFSLMSIAEEEIAKAKERHPEKTDLLHCSFSILRPTDPIRGKAECVYRSHARELLERTAKGQDTKLGTIAEVLCVLLDTATKTPLNQEGQALTERLFQLVFKHSVDGSKPVEQWPGQIEEALSAAQKKVYFNWRKNKA
jgi:hypothetical protein